MNASVVDRDEVRVMFLRTADQVDEIEGGWERLESVVPPKGRRFYGAFHAAAKEYWVCVEPVEGDDPIRLGLETGVLPGGRYLRTTLRGEPPEVYRRIAPTFDELMKNAAVDESRPGIEFYRRGNEIDLLLPIRTG
jgi:hypothetical protein